MDEFLYDDASALTRQVIDLILASPLNISVIPDNIERELYAVMFNSLQKAFQTGSFKNGNCLPCSKNK